MDVPEIDVGTLADEWARGAAAPLVDVRQPDEYDEFHVPGAQLIPLAEVPDRLDEIPTGDAVYVICRTGGRSRKAAELLRAKGYDAINVAGGSLAWQDAGHPVITGSARG